LNSKGIDCKIIEDEKDSNKIMDIAIKENRIFVTSNMKVFNIKVPMYKCCVHYRAHPKSNYFSFFIIRLIIE
jgi:hypothetical protein